MIAGGGVGLCGPKVKILTSWAIPGGLAAAFVSLRETHIHMALCIICIYNTVSSAYHNTF